MTDPNGIIDLAALKQPAGSAPAGAASAGTPSAHEVAVTEQGLEQLIADSQQIPTLLLVTSARVPEADQFLASLRRAVEAKAGAVRLGIVDADTQQRVAGALQVEQLPTLLLLLKGQLQPIVQSVIPDAEIDNLLTQVMEVARQQGMELPEGEGTPITSSRSSRERTCRTAARSSLGTSTSTAIERMPSELPSSIERTMPRSTSSSASTSPLSCAGAVCQSSTLAPGATDSATVESTGMTIGRSGTSADWPTAESGSSSPAWTARVATDPSGIASIAPR